MPRELADLPRIPAGTVSLIRSAAASPAEAAADLGRVIKQGCDLAERQLPVSVPAARSGLSGAAASREASSAIS